jgi:uncharacterized protein YciI
MEAITNNKERLAGGMRLEKTGELELAAAIYRKIADKDPFNQEAVGRLLVVYRKLNNYREELAVIRRVLAAYEEHDKVRQEKWIREHSKAAAAGTAVFQKLGGARVSGFGADPVVATLTRRRAMVERKLPGKKGVRSVGKPAAKPTPRKRAVRKKEELQRKKAAAEQRRQEAEQRKAETAARKHPSLFVITLQYRKPLKEIDAAMTAHVAFLNKHYEQGDFLVSGRQEPRVGGIILSRGKDRAAVERMMQADPLVKKGLATAEVVEFKASQTAKGLTRYFGSLSMY